MKLRTVPMIAMTLVSIPSFAAKFEKLKAPTNKNANAVYAAFASTKQDFTYAGAYKVVTATDARGRNAEDLHLAEIKEAMHKYMCGFFDDGINIVRVKDASKIMSDLSSDLSDDTLSNKLSEVLPAFAKEASLEVYSGNAGGNNTAGEVVGAYDKKNNEVIYVGFTNCGSDG